MLKRAAKALARRAAGTLGYGLVPVPTVKPSGIFRRLLRGPSEEHPTVRSVKEHLENAVTPATLPPLGARWGAYAMRLSSRLRELSTPEEVVLLGQMPEAGVETHFRSPELIGHCYGTDLELLADLPPDLYKAFSSFRAPQIVHDVFTVQYQGRALDFVTLCAARIILGILHLLDRDLPKTVCDIGGGTGKFALSWLTNSAHRPDLVVIIDLPETLVYSETLLRTELGDSRVQYVTSPTSRLSRSGAILCPIANVSALKDISFDLITNLFSMQEMTDNWIDCYMQWLDQQPCRFFYSENYFAGPIVNMIEGHNSWSPRPSPEWLLIDAKFGFGTRPWAKMLYQKQDNGRSWMPRPSARGAEAWLGALELARRQLDEASLRSATEFAQAQMPFVPKEAWQVAKMLAEITDSECDRQSFREIDLLRRSGNEAVH